MKERLTDSDILDRCPQELRDHLLRVANVAGTATWYGNRDYEVALFHDVVEDGYATWDEMESLLGTKYYDVAVIDALKLLTNDKTMSYEAYIERIAESGNLPAIRVKILDLLDHFLPYQSSTFPRKKLDTYLAALRRLTVVLQEGEATE